MAFVLLIVIGIIVIIVLHIFHIPKKSIIPTVSLSGTRCSTWTLREALPVVHCISGASVSVCVGLY